MSNKLNNSFRSTNLEPLGNNGVVYKGDKFFTVYDNDNFKFCWLFMSNDFDKYLSLRGKCKFEIFYGSVKINSVDFIGPFKEKIYSPLSHPLVTIEVGNNASFNYLTLEECINYLNSLDVLNGNELRLLKCIFDEHKDLSNEHKWIALRLERIECSISDDIIQFREFRKLFEVDLKFPFSKDLKFSVTKVDEPSYIMTKEILDCIEEITKNKSNLNQDISVAMVGPKDAGKSSLMRTLVNNFFANGFKEVCVIDGDPGQSEFCPSGCLSLVSLTRPLLGPPFTNQYSDSNILKLFFLGDTSPNTDPKLYCRSFESLYHSYLDTFPNTKPPLIVNTMGWTQGLGVSLLKFKLLITNPTHVVQLKKGRSEKEFFDINNESLTEACKNENLLKKLPKQFDSKVHILNSVISSVSRNELILKPSHHRDLMMLTYLFKETSNLPLCFSKDLLPVDYNTNPVTRLQCRIPVTINYVTKNVNDITEDVSHPIMSLKMVYSDIDQDTREVIIGDCFSMQWVAICLPPKKPKYDSVISDNKYLRMREEQPRQCIGMGLVSHSRPQKKEVDLLTGVDVHSLNRSYLVKGNVFLPDCLLLNQREIVSKTNKQSVPFVAPMVKVGVGRTSINTRKSLPKIRRHNY